MSKPPEPTLGRKRRLLAHALAAITLAVFAYLLVRNFRHTAPLPQPTPAEYMLIALGVPAVLSFWGWMLADFLRNRTRSKSVAWGWFLVLGNWLAALVYFFVMWRPRHARR